EGLDEIACRRIGGGVGEGAELEGTQLGAAEALEGRAEDSGIVGPKRRALEEPAGGSAGALGRRGGGGEEGGAGGRRRGPQRRVEEGEVGAVEIGAQGALDREAGLASEGGVGAELGQEAHRRVAG